MVQRMLPALVVCPVSACTSVHRACMFRLVLAWLLLSLLMGGIWELICQQSADAAPLPSILRFSLALPQCLQYCNSRIFLYGRPCLSRRQCCSLSVHRGLARPQLHLHTSTGTE